MYFSHLQDTDQEKCVEVRTPRRGRSSQPTGGAEKDRHKEPEKLEETSSRLGRHSEAAAKEPTAGKRAHADVV